MDTPKFIDTTSYELGIVRETHRYFKSEDGRWKLLVIDLAPTDSSAEVMRLLERREDRDTGSDIPSLMTKDWGKKEYLLYALNEKTGIYFYAQAVDSFKEVVEFFKSDPQLNEGNQIEFKSW